MLKAGTRLGPYEIVAQVGAGGMGEVYKARDTRLDRLVAVKVLPAVASSPDARQRFEREARTISQLSHPHICAIFDVGEAPNPESRAPNPDSISFLVMELLDGETLADRLARGALPLEETLRYGAEIADALDKAQRHGVVHRDLKPANVFLARSGARRGPPTVKLLDFGLAKAAAPLFHDARHSMVDTAAVRPELTEQGSIAGTLHYMAPEQLEGKTVDARSDLFAFGAVLYEMATAKKAFSGGSPVAVASAILHQAPPEMSSAAQPVPRALERVVRGCLAKDPDERWQTAHDVKLQLQAIAEDRLTPLDAAAATSSTKPRTSRAAGWIPWLMAGGALAVAVVSATRSHAPAAAPRTARFLMALPPDTSIPDTVETVPFAVSPDGSQLAFIASERDGPSRLWLRAMSSVDARPLPGTEGADGLFWSPDSRSLGFFAANKLKRVDIQGGAVLPLCDVRERIGKAGTWGRDGQILFATIEGEAIYRTSTAGTPPVPEQSTDRERGVSRLAWPSFLPDGRRYLYLMKSPRGESSLMLGEPGQPPRVVMPLNSTAQYVAPGYLVFVRDGVLLGQRFDLASGRVAGEPISIANPVRHFFSSNWSAFSISSGGTLVYQAQGEMARLGWFDRAGRDLGALGTPAEDARMHLTADGGKVVFDRRRPGLGTMDIWSIDLARGVETRLTSAPDTEAGPVLLPDGRTLIFGSTTRGGPPNLVRKNLDTGAEEFLLPFSRLLQQAEDITPDGKVLLFSQRAEGGSFDLWTLPLTGAPAPTPLVTSPADEGAARVSPDGRFVAFISNESGRYEIYVAPMTAMGVRTRVSRGGGWAPRWSRDSGELFYLALDRHVMAAAVRTAPALSISEPTAVLAIPGRHLWTSFEVTADARRLLAVIPEIRAAEQPLTVVLNWLGGIDR